MSINRFLLYTVALALFSLLPASASAHPATGIVVDGHGRILFSDLETVWRLDASGRLTVFRPAVRGRHVHELSIDKEGNVYGGPRVRELSPDGTLKVLATVGLKENVATRLTSPRAAEADCVAAEEYERNVDRVERALGLYFALGVVAIGVVAWLKGFVRRSGHA